MSDRRPSRSWRAESAVTGEIITTEDKAEADVLGALGWMVDESAPVVATPPLWKIPEFWMALAPWLCLLLFAVGLLVVAVAL